MQLVVLKKFHEVILLTSINIAVLTNERRLYGSIKSTMRDMETNWQVELITSPDLIRITEHHWLIVDTSSFSPADLDKALTGWQNGLIALTSFVDVHSINVLLDQYKIDHIVGVNGRNCVSEIITIIRKSQSGSVFGLSNYAETGAVVSDWTIDHAGSVDQLVQDIADKVDWDQTFSEMKESFKTLANELITNAIYNAPRNESGIAKYKETDRRIKIELAESEVAHVTLIDHPEYVGISVCDQFGGLSRIETVKHLVKCVNDTQFIDYKLGGSGAGIYVMYYTVSQFIINCDAGKKLEVIGIIEKTKRYKRHRQRVTSFSYFAVDGGKR